MATLNGQTVKLTLSVVRSVLDQLELGKRDRRTVWRFAQKDPSIAQRFPLQVAACKPEGKGLDGESN